MEGIYWPNGTVPSDIGRGALNRKHFDAALDLLERRLPGRRLAVRRALTQALKPKLRLRNDPNTTLLRSTAFRSMRVLRYRGLGAGAGCHKREDPLHNLDDESSPALAPAI